VYLSAFLDPPARPCQPPAEIPEKIFILKTAVPSGKWWEQMRISEQFLPDGAFSRRSQAKASGLSAQ
jgi:hypothetical protein